MTTSPASPDPLPPFLARAVADGLMGADAAEDCLRAHRELLAIGQELTLDDIAEIKGYLTAEQAEAIKQALFAESSAPRFQAATPVIAAPEDPGIAAGAFGDRTDASAFFPPRPASAAPSQEAQAETAAEAPGGRRVVACSRCRAKIATQRPEGSLTVCPRCGGAFVIGGAAVEALVVRKDPSDAGDAPRRLVECPACGVKVSTARPSWALEPCPGCGHDYPPAGDEAAAPAPQAAPGSAVAPPVTGDTPAPSPAPSPPPQATPDSPAPLPEAPTGVASETLRRGSIIGPYHIESQLGRRPGGGVYVAIGPGGSRVRLKVLGPEPDPLARASFLRQATFLIRSFEKRQAGGLLRPTARGEAGDLLWVATELAAGKTLAERIAEGPIPEAEAARLAALIAQRLSELHEGGMVHRRLKPSNVVLEGGTDVALADPGIGLPRADAVDEEAGRFRAPELAAGQTGASDLRADLFALGAVFFDMIGGKLSSPALAVVIGALLDQNPAGRPASAAEVVRSIERSTKPRGEPGSRAHSPDPGAAAGGRPPASGGEKGSTEHRLASAARRSWLAGAVVGAAAAVAVTLVVIALYRGGLDGGAVGPVVGNESAPGVHVVVATPPPAPPPSAPSAGATSGGKAPIEERAPPAPTPAGGASGAPTPAKSVPVPLPDDALGDALLRVRAAVAAGDLDEAQRALNVATQMAPIGDPRCAAAGAVIEQAAKSLRASLEASVTAWLVHRESLGCPSCRFVREVACRACKGTGRDAASLSGRCPTCGGCGRTPCAAPGCVRGYDRAALRAVAFDPLSDAARRAIEIDGIDFFVEGIAACSLGEPASSALARAAWQHAPAAFRPIARLERIDYEVLGGDAKVHAKVSYRGGAAIVEETHWRRDGGAWRLDLGLDADARGGGAMRGVTALGACALLALAAAGALGGDSAPGAAWQSQHYLITAPTLPEAQRLGAKLDPFFEQVMRAFELDPTKPVSKTPWVIVLADAPQYRQFMASWGIANDQSSGQFLAERRILVTFEGRQLDRTLLHEGARQLVQIAFPYVQAPTWFAEGAADFLEALDYRAPKLETKAVNAADARALRDLLEHGERPKLADAVKLSTPELFNPDRSGPIARKNRALCWCAVHFLFNEPDRIVRAAFDTYLTRLHAGKSVSEVLAGTTLAHLEEKFSAYLDAIAAQPEPPAEPLSATLGELHVRRVDLADAGPRPTLGPDETRALVETLEREKALGALRDRKVPWHAGTAPPGDADTVVVIFFSDDAALLRLRLFRGTKPEDDRVFLDLDGKSEGRFDSAATATMLRQLGGN